MAFHIVYHLIDILLFGLMQNSRHTLYEIKWKLKCCHQLPTFVKNTKYVLLEMLSRKAIFFFPSYFSKVSKDKRCIFLTESRKKFSFSQRSTYNPKDYLQEWMEKHVNWFFSFTHFIFFFYFLCFFILDMTMLMHMY